jgi:hypothetical protein
MGNRRSLSGNEQVSAFMGQITRTPILRAGFWNILTFIPFAEI